MSFHTQGLKKMVKQLAEAAALATEEGGAAHAYVSLAHALGGDLFEYCNYDEKY